MDNTQNERRMLQDFYTQDARLVYSVKNLLFREINLILQVNNVFNSLYEPNGFTYPYIYAETLINDNYYYPMAGTNFMAGVNMKF